MRLHGEPAAAGSASREPVWGAQDAACPEGLAPHLGNTAPGSEVPGSRLP